MGACSRSSRQRVLPTLVWRRTWPLSTLPDLTPEMLGHVRRVLVDKPELWGKALPSKLAYLTFCDDFIEPLEEDALPSTLKHLTFGEEFNQPLAEGVLPSTLQHLTFGARFDQPLAEGVLPTHLKLLAFGTRFNQPLAEGVLPSTLEQLTFGHFFNQPLAEGVLSSTLKSLVFCDMRGRHRPLTEVPENVLPASVRAKLTCLMPG